MIYMLDSDVCIFTINKKCERRIKCLDQLKNNNSIVVSSIVLSELEFGVANSIHKERNKRNLYRFLTRIVLMDYSSKYASYYGEIRANLTTQGKPIGSNDLFIAAHAIAENATLITNNTREFERIENLKILSWQEL